jgi:hypothetical protein
MESDSVYGYVSIHEACEDYIREEEQWEKMNVSRKRASYIEKDYLKKSRNYCSTGNRTAEQNIHHEDPVSTKNFQCELHNSNIQGRATAAKLLITKINAQMRG